MRYWAWILAVLILCLNGCAGGIESNKLAGYTQQLKKLYVILHYADKTSNDYKEDFRSTLSEILTDCGLEFVIDTTVPVDSASINFKSGQARQQQSILKYNPEAVLTVAATTYQTQYNNLVRITHFAQITEFPANKPVWKAEIKTSDWSFGFGKALANVATDRMKKDQLLACKTNT